MGQGWFSNWQLAEARQSRCVWGGAVKQDKKSLRQVSKMQHQNRIFRINQQAGNQRYHNGWIDKWMRRPGDEFLADVVDCGEDQN